MQKVNRLGWANGISISTYGIRIGLRAQNAQTLSRLLECLPPRWQESSASVVERLYSVILGDETDKPSSGAESSGAATSAAASRVRRFSLLYGDFTRVARTLEPTEILDVLETDIKMYVAEKAPRHVFIHAGVVGWQDHAILIPGRTFTGKTTLVAELVRAGATYYSDEYAVLDKAGRVHPYAKPLSIREDGTARPTKYAATTLGGRAGRKPLPVGMIITTQYRNGARWRPRQLSVGQGALALLSNTVSARHAPQAALAALQHAVPQALVLESVRGDAKDIVPDLLQRWASQL